jgi:hypothetical protein
VIHRPDKVLDVSEAQRSFGPRRWFEVLCERGARSVSDLHAIAWQFGRLTLARPPRMLWRECDLPPAPSATSRSRARGLILVAAPWIRYHLK